MKITKIVITGGPCAGKSSAMEYLEEKISNLGYKVIFVAETATELMTGGVTPLSCDSVAEYQKLQMRLQIEKEKIFEQAAKTMNFDKVLIVCDRGTLDCKAYMEEADFIAATQSIGTNETLLRDNYDAVFHLVTTAKGALHAYNTENNSVRTETPKMAAELDDKLISAWTGHPHFRVIDNSTDFEDKKKRLVDEIAAFLGEPKPYEIERKFLIEYPNVEWLANNPACKRVEIIQT
ncbi:MAG: ATP-binding protein, partial [Clostridia bacterium]|nr:ATP-binding protein [Clostridia bacterium]